jgi:hypothetical protein
LPHARIIPDALVRHQPNAKAVVLPAHILHEEEEEMQDHRPFDVMVQCSVYHEGHHHPIVLAFDKEHPFAVELVFMPELVSYVFARETLFQAAIQGVPTGELDIHIDPVYTAERGSHLVLTLKDYEGETFLSDHVLILDRRTAQKFLYTTFDLVQLGEEDYTAQVDAFLLEMQS